MTGVVVRQESAGMIERSAPLPRADFNRIFLAERGAVQRHLVYLTGDSATAEDLTQEAFGKLYERGAAEDGEALRNPRAWLLKVASNLAYNHFRSERRREAREAEPAEVHEADVDDVLDVRRALSVLEPRDRVVLLLRHSGASYAEVADALGLAPSSIGTILARAQRRFRLAYEGRVTDVRE